MFPFVTPFPSLADVFMFTLVFCRIAGLFAAIPLFGGRRISNRFKIAVVFAITIVCLPVLPVKPPPLPNDTISMGLLILKEVAVGLTLAFITQLIFAAVEFSGQIIGVQMGFSMAQIIDPTMGAQTQIMSVIQGLLASLFFLSLNIHHLFISAIIDSFKVIPLGGWRMTEELIHFLVTTSSGLLVLGIRLAAPVMVTLLLTSVVLGIMARSFPQMNVFMISFPLNIGLGFMILGSTLLFFFQVLEISFGQLKEQIGTLFRLMAKGG